MNEDEKATIFLTPSIEEAATLEALGNTIVGCQPVTEEEVADLKADGYLNVAGDTLLFRIRRDVEDFDDCLARVRAKETRLIPRYQQAVKKCYGFIRKAKGEN